jgi:predicted acyl esterase
VPISRLSVYLLALCALAGAVPAAHAFTVQPGIELVSILDATEGTEFVLEDSKGAELGRGNADRFGSLIFRYLEEGVTYTLRDTSEGGTTQDVTTLRLEDHPDQSFYDGQTLEAGLQYIEMRDGTKLAAMVRPPLGFASMDQGPFPTVIEYSGYAVADPGHQEPGSLIAWAMGYATVGVNMRGSGCSGGVLDLFDLPTTADGYDVVEAVAAQSWAQGHKVGMVGISFPGISQLFVGGVRPPHLAALTPLSVIADIYRAPGFPGGIFNNGFAQSWLLDRQHDGEPAPEGGQQWAIDRVNEGDTVCLENQKLRLQGEDPLEVVEAHPYYTPELHFDRSPINWVSNIDVPTFLASAWQDEQTGSDFASMLSRFPKRKDVKITVTNGVHSSSFDPAILWNWLAFLDLYVADRIPDPGRMDPLVVSVLYPQILGDDTYLPPVPDDRFDDITDYDEARKLFESDPPVRVLMENGAGSPTPGLMAPTFEFGLKKWPPPQVKPTSFYFGPEGTLTKKKPTKKTQGTDTYHPDPEARPSQTLPGQGQDDSWKLIPDYDWLPYPEGTAVAYVSEPLTSDMVVAGTGSVDLWLRSSAADTDLQVTLTEVRPDGLETYVQSGWLRASHRKLDKKTTTKTDPRPTHLEADAAPLPAGEFTKVRVEIFAVAHAFRAGSRVRISVEAPGGDRTRWAFNTPATGGLVANDIARTAKQASRVVLSVVPGIEVPPGLPPCPGLRGQPCRTYEPATNGG